MPFIAGGSLRQRLDHTGAMEATEALALVAPVQDALAYAHRMGVLHRDIKPENILFSEGHPVVADFGIAKAISVASDKTITRTGLALGTPGYMSPEQAAGFRDVTERTDVYSLAVVTYEMLVGEIPGCWPGEESVRAGRFLEAVPAHGSRLAALGPAVEGALVRGLAVRQDQRTPTAAQFLSELRGVPEASAPTVSHSVAPRASMVPDLETHRRFRPTEVDEIVKRAAELEVSRPTMGGAMTLGGVESVAREAGIPTELVRVAAEELTQRPRAAAGVALRPVERSILAGGPSRIVYERVVSGRLAESDFPLVVDEIRGALRNAGQVSQLGQSFSWTTRHRSGRSRRDVEVVVAVRGNTTRITVQESLGQLMGAVFGGIVGGAGGGGMGPIIGITVGALHTPAAIPIILPLWLATTYSVARAVYHYSTKRRERELSELTDRLERTVKALNGAP